jgi:ABC-type lipoprotein export system ATPase subunit
MSLEAEEKTAAIFSQINLFLDTIKSFITDKTFQFRGGDLTVSTTHGPIAHDKLSSGEKQLLILLIEALLQKRKPHVFLADEPELSLHISWQRKIIPAVLDLNPNAQVIVATHSPEVASRYKNAIFDMEEVVSG